MSHTPGQLMMIGFEGKKPSKELLDFLRKEKIGGVILFERNWQSPKQLKSLIDALQDASGGKLFVGVDQEGGRIIRFHEPFTHFPAPAEIAERVIPAEAGIQSRGGLAYNIAYALATELSAVGVNLNFAPVLDLLTNPKNTVIGDRSFGSDPALVSEFALQTMRGLLDVGVMPCGKHFPGHGDTAIDSHKRLPVVQNTLERLRSRELVPFKKLIDAGLPSIMTAHILFPEIDESIATVSEKITTGLLRKELGFNGIIFTDDLIMKGISGQMPIEIAASLSLAAGSDMILICENFTIQKRVADHLKRAADNSELSDLEEKLNCIASAKLRFCDPTIARPPLTVIGCKEHRAL